MSTDAEMKLLADALNAYDGIHIIEIDSLQERHDIPNWKGGFTWRYYIAIDNNDQGKYTGEFLERHINDDAREWWLVPDPADKDNAHRCIVEGKASANFKDLSEQLNWLRTKFFHKVPAE